MHRRMLLAATGSAVLAEAEPEPLRIRAIAFDGFTILDPRSIGAAAEDVFPGKGADLSNAWRTRQFEYTWLRTLMGTYLDFRHVTEEALEFAAASQHLPLTKEKKDRLMRAFFAFRPWPEAVAALKRMKASGIRLAFLSNFTEEMLDAAVRSCGLEGLFDPHLSTDKVRAFKPDARAYQMAIDAFRLSREEIAFAAFGGWDAAGAKTFGFPTFWVNRMQLPVERLGVAPDGTGASLDDLERFVISRR